jgi:hypothetical protein
MAERDAAWERIQKDPRLSHMDLGDEDLTFMSQVINDLILTYLPRA